MITDETHQVRSLQGGQLEKALSAIWLLGDYFGRETLSAAIGELSERFIQEYTSAKRQKRGANGHDLVGPTGELIEVKARFVSKYDDTLQFNFGPHTKNANLAFCLAWTSTEDQRPNLKHVFKITVPFLIEKWGTPNQNKYCARTNLGNLRKAVVTRP